MKIQNPKFKIENRRAGIFITGTDTGVGKTLVCGLLAGYLRGHGLRVITQKWVQTGDDDDVAMHRKIGDSHLFSPPPQGKAGTGTNFQSACFDYQKNSLENSSQSPFFQQGLVNPYRFRLAASPLLAAREEGREIDAAVISEAYSHLREHYDMVLVEGVGGALVPLTDDLLIADLAAQLRLPAILVVRNSLGCVNHSLLTIEALCRRGISILGLIFTRTSPGGNEIVLRDNPAAVADLSGVPLLGELPFLDDLKDAAASFAPIGEAFSWSANIPQAR